jgi:predicted PurR-regulated permease PerM
VVIGHIINRLLLMFLALFGAFLLSSLLSPVSNWLVSHRWPKTLASLVSVLALCVAVGGALTWIGPAAISTVSEHSEALAQRARALVQNVNKLVPGQQPTLDALGAQAEQWIQKNTQSIAMGAANSLFTALSAVSGALLTIVLTFFFVRDGEMMMRSVFSPLPPKRRRAFTAAAESAWRTFSRWTRGTALVALIDGAGIGIGLLILGVPLAIPLALLTFVAAFVPIVGAVIAGAVAVLVAWATSGGQDALIALAIVVGVQQLEGNVLQPVIMGNFLPIGPVVVLLVVTAGTLLAGVAGALVAVPLVAALTSGAQAFLRERGRRPFQNEGLPSEPSSANL